MKFHSQHYLVGEQADHTPVPEQLEAGPFRKSRSPEPLRFEVNMVAQAQVIIDSPEPPERIQALLEEAESSCMAHHALRNPMPWSTRLVYNGAEIDTRDSAD